MALIVCRTCGKAFISGPKEEKICPGCAVRLRELYPLIRSFLRNNDGKAHTAQDISRDMNIALKDVVALVSMDLLRLNVGYGAVDDKKR